ncbi:hypothetical protein KKG08_02460 [Patescibacteria group bacterium]|nr:hypothetical protein [Patescibacteria group bacterium]
MNDESISESSQEPRENDSEDRFGEIQYHPIYQNPMNKDITLSILEKERSILPVKIPPLGSSQIEDYIVDKVVNKGLEEDEIVDVFFKEGMEGKVLDYLKEIEQISEKLDWTEIICSKDVRDIKGKVVEEMKDLGFSDKDCSYINSLEVEVRDSSGVSSTTQEGVYVNKYQAVRKAIDMLSFYRDNQYEPKEITRVLMLNVVAHEIGHKIENLKNYTNYIPEEEGWDSNDHFFESKSERFAEYWAHFGGRNNESYSDIVRRDHLMHIAKTFQIWSDLESHSEKGKNKASILTTLDKINIRANTKGFKSFIFARRVSYAEGRQEFYALPYSREVIKKSIQDSEKPPLKE